MRSAPTTPARTSSATSRDSARRSCWTCSTGWPPAARIEIPQDDAAATYAHRLRKEEGLIDWRAAAAAIHNQVRGLQPWPMAWTFFGGRRVILVRTRAVPEAPDRGNAPGSIVEIPKDALRVQTGGGLLDVLTVQPEGRRAMAARDFAAGHHVEAGLRFDPPPVEPAPAPPAGRA